MINLMDIGHRLQLIREIDGPENKARKAQSLRQFEIFNDRQHQYVLEYLRGQFSEKTVREMPIISSINLARRVVKQESSLYKTAPKREFYGVSEEQEVMLQAVYADYGYNDRFLKANEYFKLQEQTHLHWVLQYGKIKPRVLMPHHLDVVPLDEDPEMGQIYIVSSFDKKDYLRYENPTATGYRGNTYQGLGSDGANQKIGDPDDYRTKRRFTVWSKDFNFIMDENGVIVSGPEVENPLNGIIPFIDISSSKDFEYWVRQGQSVSDFSIQFNGMISDVANVVRLQGWGQAIFSGPEGLLPESLQIGPNHVIRLPIDANNPTPTDFKYVTPNADIAGSLDFLKMNLSMFMSSRGIDPKSISMDGTGQNFSSGLERLLSMISKFEASKEDMDIFKKTEMKSYEILKAYINAFSGTDLLEVSVGALPEDSWMTIQFAEPQLIQSEKEKLDLIQQKMDLGIISKVSAYMAINDVDEETALKELREIDGEGQGPNTIEV
jgi:hypothetical protein